MKKYQIIYADPPWRFKYYGKTNDRYRRAEGHYKIMDLEDIRALPINNLADNNCCLFLWAIHPMLPMAFDVMKSWGFTYKTIAFTWVKSNKTALGFFEGMGYWTRANPELCLLGTQGQPKRISQGVLELVIAPRREHSQKPDEVRYRIIELLGNIPRIELFARRKVDGWDCWGNEVESDIEL